MSAATITIVFGAHGLPDDQITASLNGNSTHAPIRVDMEELAVFLSHCAALRLVDQLTAALAAHKAAHDFHRGAGGAG